MRIEFFIPGRARPAGSKGAFRHKHTGEIIVTHANPATKEWMNTVKSFALEAAKRHVQENPKEKITAITPANRPCQMMIRATGMKPTTEAVCLKLVFLRDRPQAHYGTGRNAGVLKKSAPPHLIQTPDLTKLIRAVEDGLTGIIWKDDKQVIAQATIKRYCRGDEIPGVQVIVETVHGLKGFYDGKEKEIRGQGTGFLFGSVGREGGNDGGD